MSLEPPLTNSTLSRVVKLVSILIGFGAQVTQARISRPSNHERARHGADERTRPMKSVISALTAVLATIGRGHVWSQPGVRTLLVILLLVVCNCGSPTAPQPSPLQPSPPQPSPPSSPELIGLWQGSTTVESAGGILPECVAPFWRPGFADAVSAQIQSRQILDGPKVDLDFHQQAADDCHLQIGASDNLVTGGPWGYDEFDCAIIPSLCGLGCHFRLNSSDWGCQGLSPDVWILGINLNGTFADATRTRIQGTVEIGYDHRAGNSHGGYSRATIVERFDIRKASP